MRQISVILQALFFCAVSLGQVKVEQEYRLQEADVPEESIEIVAAMDFVKKPRWYKEIGLHTVSVEAKGIKNGKKHSVEFNESGTIEDVEITIPWQEIPNAIQKRIKQELNKQFLFFKIKKIQEHYGGNRDTLISLVKNPSKKHNSPKYEIVVKGRNQIRAFYECMFSSKGVLETKKRIVNRSLENLEF